MRILAIDPATKCGWALLGKNITHGVKDFHNKQWDGAGMRFLKFRAFIHKIHKKRKLDLIAYEAVESHVEGGTYAAHIYGGWVAELQSYGERHDIPYTGLPVGEIKRFWTGKGNASKKMMIWAAQEQGFNPKDDNAADALAILHLAIDKYAWD